MVDFEKLAREIADLLSSYDCQRDVAIYFDNKRLQAFTTNETKGEEWVLEEGYLASTYVEYANNDTITMTFEGDFYDVMNYGYLPELANKFLELVTSYGFYFELGNAWNLALYNV